VRDKSKFACRPKLIWVVQSSAQKYCAFVFSESDVHFARSAPSKGRIAIAVNVARNAVDGPVS